MKKARDAETELAWKERRWGWWDKQCADNLGHVNYAKKFEFYSKVMENWRDGLRVRDNIYHLKISNWLNYNKEILGGKNMGKEQLESLARLPE